jgi:hypothetical protein
MLIKMYTVKFGCAYKNISSFERELGGYINGIHVSSSNTALSTKLIKRKKKLITLLYLLTPTPRILFYLATRYIASNTPISRGCYIIMIFSVAYSS